MKELKPLDGLPETVPVKAFDLLNEIGPPRIAISPHGRIVSFIGYMRIEDADYPHPDCRSTSLGARDMRESRAENEGFVALCDGALSLDRFIKPDDEYRLFSNYLVAGMAKYGGCFGAVHAETQELHDELSRHLFGVTCGELAEFLTVFGAVVHLPPSQPEQVYRVYRTLRYPRITASDKRENTCDLTGVLIPEDFPFIAFGDTNFLFGHVSLQGFYRHLSFLCKAPYGHPSNLYRSLVSAGASAIVLDRLIGLGGQSPPCMIHGHVV
jgi:hypothetical protein